MVMTKPALLEALAVWAYTGELVSLDVSQLKARAEAWDVISREGRAAIANHANSSSSEEEKT
jgi:hypothetical protein